MTTILTSPSTPPPTPTASAPVTPTAALPQAPAKPAFIRPTLTKQGSVAALTQLGGSFDPGP